LLNAEEMTLPGLSVKTLVKNDLFPAEVVILEP